MANKKRQRIQEYITFKSVAGQQQCNPEAIAANTINTGRSIKVKFTSASGSSSRSKTLVN
jgi:hypothetical protein